MLIAAVLLGIGVAAVAAAATVRLAADDGPRIASVRLGQLAAAHAAEAARANASPQETAAAVRNWARALEDALGEVAARHRIVLLPARAVAAGAPDLTAEVEAAMARRLVRPAAGGGMETGR